jgi:phage baseplate assembly protein W
MIEISTDPQPINWNPDVTQEIIQNVRTIIMTVQGNVPLDREFGLDNSVLDDPIPIAQARLAGIVTTAIRIYEPRAAVVKVRYETAQQIDALKPIVQIEIVDESEEVVEL